MAGKRGVNGKGKAPKAPKRSKKEIDEWLEQLATEQGVKLPQRYEDIVGTGTHLWKTEKEFQDFLAILEDIRKGR